MHLQTEDTRRLERIAAMKATHSALFSHESTHMFSAPGRTELGGNHTDHNLGKVLCASVALDSLAAVHKTSDGLVRVHSAGYAPICVDLSDLGVHEDEKGTTAALIRGIAASIVKRGGSVGGFTANITSEIMPGSGLSSSASIEVLFAEIWNTLCNGNAFTKIELAKIGREAENDYFGKPCGLMDQIACANGGIVKIDFADGNDPLLTPIVSDFEKFGYRLLLVDSGTSHADLSDDYAAITRDMRAVAGCFGKAFLRQISFEEFDAEKIAVARQVGQRAVERAEHFFHENDRVDSMVDALTDGDFAAYLGTVNLSGRSSETLLRNILPSGVRKNRLQQALDTAKLLLNGQGAYRVHGGGFAGTIQVYVPLGGADEFIRQTERRIGAGCCQCVRIRDEGVTELA